MHQFPNVHNIFFVIVKPKTYVHYPAQKKIEQQSFIKQGSLNYSSVLFPLEMEFTLEHFVVNNVTFSLPGHVLPAV